MSFEPFLALEASAGSGKTFALSVRFVALALMPEVNLNEIRAITFTKKAANEMQGRIIDTFLNLQDKANELNELCKLLDKNKDEILNLRDARKTTFLRTELKISTFDSFFGQILRAFALNLGLMSDFKLSEEIKDLRAVFLKLLSREELKDLAYYIVELDEKENFFKELESLYHNAYFKEFEKRQNPSKEKINKAYLNLREFIVKNGELLVGKQNNNLQKLFKNESLNLDEFLDGFLGKLKAQNTPQYLQRLLHNKEFSQAFNAFETVLNEYGTELEAFKLSRLMRLLSHFSEAKNTAQKNKNLLSFADITRRVLELIQSDLRDMIYFRLDGKIAHLLIDEFQDTSVIQYQILKPLIAELISGEGTRAFRSFFYVGDKKQSIYGFRQSKKELFDFLRFEFSQIKLQSLDTNYRSFENLVKFINESFKDKFTNYLPQKLPLDSAKKGGFVRVVQSEEKEAKKELIALASLDMLKIQLNELHKRQIPWEKICILCWTNDNADLILNFLKKEKIPAFTQSNIMLENKATVRLVLEYAKFCIFKDEFYKVFLKELLGFEPLCLKLDISRGAAQNVLYLAKNLRLDLSDLGLLQFLEYARSKENLMQLLFEPCDLKIVSEESKGLSIMTVHKSKGLEFDHVILLDRLTKNNLSKESIMLDFSVNEGWNLQLKSKIFDKTSPQFYANFIQKMQKAQLDDDINKLYVAMTRARESLIIIKRNENCINKSYPSYFKELLNLKDQELGELNQESMALNLTKKELKENLGPFEKVSKQELSSTKIEHSKELYFGIAFHFFMQHCNFDGSNFKALCERTRSKFRHFLEEKDFNELFTRLKTLLENSEFQGLLRNKKHFRERNLSFKGELKQLDLLCIDENEATVIDYKTGESDKIGNEMQVRLYKEAVFQILGLKTRAFVLYCLNSGLYFKEL
ncbi:RecB-like helicase [Campylobacter troglodytis]|uniref:RecB-like helicase n=1 Tax=Campylobacter troglodytis TaxID=654363 RepID=UPI001159D3A0|nr:RecB-like helicase [Campylobacter troglodytis]TQR54466.1 RecB-like helicase [Campylobacter troglodytis]